MAVVAKANRLHAVLCVACYNIRWLLCMISREGGGLPPADLFAPVQIATLLPNWVQMKRKTITQAISRSVTHLA